MELLLQSPLKQQQGVGKSKEKRINRKKNTKTNNIGIEGWRGKVKVEKGGMMVEQEGGKKVVELVGAFNELKERMKSSRSVTWRSRSSRSLLFESLKLCIPLLHDLPPPPFSLDGRSPLSKSLSLSLLLADLQMDAEVISAGLLRHAFEAGAISINQIRNRIGTATAHLLHESLRVNNMPSRVLYDLDDETASALRKFSLTYYDVRAVILDLAIKLDAMRHLDSLPRYHQQLFALQVLKIHAPLAHALGIDLLSLELEDLSFRYLFPYSYLYVDTWLRSLETGGKPLIDMYLEQLHESLLADSLLSEMVEDITIKGRYKSRYSTMKKLLKDGRKLEEINDILGLRIILKPKSREDENGLICSELIGEKACYQTREVVRSLWKEIPHRTKDYIANPKANAYMSLHMAVDLSNNGKTRPLMEIQIRTTEMDRQADSGEASHSLYKGGLTDPEEAKRLKAIMIAAAELAALRLGEIPSSSKDSEIDQIDCVFRLLDKNGDGRISIEELIEVMEELGAPGEDAREMMQLLDSNSDGSLSSDEFDQFQKQVEFIRNIEDRDCRYRTMLDEKLQIAEDSILSEEHRRELND